MNRLFGTDGIRGIANKDLTPELVFRLARAGGYFLIKNSTDKKPKIVLGTDTRLSKDMLQAAVIAGLTSLGIDVLTVGVIPTPGVAFLTKELKADGGIVISASHNPVEYNGIKFFDKWGFKLSIEDEDEIEKTIDSIDIRPEKEQLGIEIKIKESLNIYSNYIKNNIDINLEGLKVALDCGNGASYSIAPKLLQELGAEVYVLNSQPNGLNINVNCGSTYPEEISTFVKETHADIGLSFDGDADRVIACDENGEIIDGDRIMASLALELKSKNKLSDDTLVVTLMSNLGLELFLKKHSINISKTKVGDRNVLNEMKINNYSLGGEQSGHIILLDYNTTGDGILTGVKLSEILIKEKIKASKLSEGMEILPQTLKNAKVDDKKKHEYKKDKYISDYIKNIEKEFYGEGRVYIRPSGTEPVVRVMLEGKNQKQIEKRALDLVEIIEKKYK